jgi:cobalt-zinc-cadmium efflux system membrane fusion protein
MLAVSCQKKTTTEAADTKQNFTLSDSMARLITIDTVKQEEVQSELKLTGKISFNEEKVIKIYPLVSGTVQDVKVELGDFVQQGQTLAIIRSNEVAGLEQEKISSSAAITIAKKNLDATEEMYKSGISSEKDLVIARKEYEKAQAEEKRIGEVFQIYNINAEGDYVIKSPIAGFVVDKNVNSQMQMRPDNNENLFTISALDEVWINANVYESDINKIKEGYEADVTTLAYGNKVFKGKVDKVFNVLDPETKVMKVRIKLQNPGYLLKPEMFATIAVHYAENYQMPSIPAEAVVFDNSKYYVVVYKSRLDMEIREVQVQKSVGGISYISSGLKPGEMVITKHHLLVYDSLNED